MIKNHKEEDAYICFEPYVWGVWEMVNTTHPINKKDGTQLEFKLSVAANSELSVQYEYKVDRRTEVVLKK